MWAHLSTVRCRLKENFFRDTLFQDFIHTSQGTGVAGVGAGGVWC